MIKRCSWADCSKLDYIEYHDNEWGVPIHDDNKIFEFLTLESAQAGLSWYTILRKRENYRALFADFNPHEIVKFTNHDIEILLKNPGIVRNRLKIESAINNAKMFIKIQSEFSSFDNYIWNFVEGKPIFNINKDWKVTSKESDIIAKDLKQRGFKFLGSTIIYAHMQATGMVNDHALDCFRREEIINTYK